MSAAWLPPSSSAQCTGGRNPSSQHRPHRSILQQPWHLTDRRGRSGQTTNSMKPPYSFPRRASRRQMRLLGLLECRKPEGGTRQSLGKQSPTNSKSVTPTCTARDGWGEATRERYRSLVSIRGSLERPEWWSASLWDRHSKSVNIQEPHLCSRPSKLKEITVRAPHIFWLFRTQIFWLIRT